MFNREIKNQLRALRSRVFDLENIQFSMQAEIRRLKGKRVDCSSCDLDGLICYREMGTCHSVNNYSKWRPKTKHMAKWRSK